jgi:predicted enzyme involved in methoxymalonyl-ACP biosynthesis
MSCRVIGRSLEQLTLRQLASRATGLGYQRLIGEYVATAKSQLVANLYADLGFELVSSRGATRGYHMTLPLTKPPRTFVAIEAP